MWDVCKIIKLYVCSKEEFCLLRFILLNSIINVFVFFGMIYLFCKYMNKECYMYM